MALRYLRVLGEQTEEQARDAASFAASVATMGEHGCVVLPLGYALGELGGAEVANPMPPSPPRRPTWGGAIGVGLGALVIVAALLKVLA